MRSSASARRVAAAGRRMAGQAGGVDPEQRRSQERGRDRPEVLSGVAMLALEEQERRPRARRRASSRPRRAPPRPWAGRRSASRAASPGSASRSPRSRRRSARRTGRRRRARRGAGRGRRPWPRRPAARRADPSPACGSGAAAASAGTAAASATSSEIMSNGRGARMQLGCTVPSVFSSRGTTAPTRGSRNAVDDVRELPETACTSGLIRSTTSAPATATAWFTAAA